MTPNIHLHPHRPGILACPQCGGGFLGHQHLASFDRREDDVMVTVTEVNPSGVWRHNQWNDNTKNPSERRSGLRIAFACELCGAKPFLTIAQHKGMTVIAWETPR